MSEFSVYVLCGSEVRNVIVNYCNNRTMRKYDISCFNKYSREVCLQTLKYYKQLFGLKKCLQDVKTQKKTYSSRLLHMLTEIGNAR